jgi:hypothetical protein
MKLKDVAVAALGTAIWVCLASAAFGQDAVPTEMLLRTFFIKVGNATGTAFSIEYGGKIYLVTARHVATGLPEDNAVIQLRQDNQWKDFHTVKTIFPSSGDADIAVFETNEPIPKPPYGIMPIGKANGHVTMGQQVWFLGFPFEGIGTQAGDFAKGVTFPFMKRGTMSAIDSSHPDAVVLYIDGFNNPGFSGGPIIFWDFSSHAYEIIGVVKGYRTDTAKVVVNGQQLDSNILVNSGILIGYSIQNALDAIDKSNAKRQ